MSQIEAFKLYAEDFVRSSKTSIDILIEAIQKKLEGDSTTLVLTKSAAIIVSAFILKRWLSQLMWYRKCNLSGPMPLPIFANLLHYSSGLQKMQRKHFKKYGKVYLFFEGSVEPIVCISDPKMIKDISIKNFNSFPQRRVFDGVNSLEVFKSFFTNVDPTEWKRIRSIVTTAFTSGRIKKMSSSVLDTCNVFTKHLDNLKDGVFESKLYSKFATDVVCSCMFGVVTDTINDPNHPLPVNISKLFGSEFTKNWRILLLLIAPKFTGFLMKHNLLKIVPQESLDYLVQLNNQIIEERVSKQTKRNDFIQMMVDHADEDHEEDEEVNDNNEPKSTIKGKLSNSEILAQSILFMLVGSDTTAVTLGWVSYNLALHPNVQDKLIEEIDTVLEKYNGEISYESVNEMQYMSSVISETQRIYSVSFTDRTCAQDYEYNGIKIKKGQHVNLALHEVHHDKNFFSEPEKFIPEREKEYLMPFGNGPKTCVAMRFALVEIKLLLTKILSKYRFEKCDKTADKYEIDDSGLSKPKVPLYLKVTRR